MCTVGGEALQDDERWLWTCTFGNTDSNVFVIVTSSILIMFICSKVLPHPSSPTAPLHAMLSLWLHLMPTELTNPILLFCLCIYSTVLSQSHSGGGGDVHLGKTSFEQKGRSMFPKVLLHWCAAISSCAAEIGKLLHHVRLCLLCRQATCAVRLWHYSRYNTKPCRWTLVVVRPALVQSRRHHQMMMRERWDAAAILWCSCILVKGISLLL